MDKENKVTKVSVFGNEDYLPDSLPIKILPELKQWFKNVEFYVEDPNELNLPDGKSWLILDTVVGLKNCAIILPDELSKQKRTLVSMHDFDLLSHLSWIKKIKSGLDIKIIGVPPQLPAKNAVEEVNAILANLLSENEKHS